LKRRTSGIKRKTLAYFIVFVVILLALLWTFQTVFLETFYKTIKRYTIELGAITLSRNIESDELQDIVDQMAIQNEMGIRIFRDNEYELTQSDAAPDDVINRMSFSELAEYYNLALQNGGTAFESIRETNNPIFTFPGMFRNSKPSEHMIYVRVFHLEDGREAMIALSTEITPVGATVYTLRIQLICITVILSILACVLALLLARNISKPIVTLNERAKKLAIGNYTPDYQIEGFREISELGNTLNYAAHELSTVETLRRDLLANISHDLRTPLTLITGYSEAMRDLPGENSPENIQKVIDEANRLTLLVNDIMELSKLQSGTQPLYPKEYALTESIQDIIARLSVLTHVQGYNITFNRQEEVFIFADPIHLERVTYNLLQNAMQHTGEDMSVVVTQIVHDGFVRIEITDTGRGIPPEELQHIWDRYYKLDRTERIRYKGTGLGLSIVKAILEAHNAQFGVTSAVGFGSTFWYELPIIQIPDDGQKEWTEESDQNESM